MWAEKASNWEEGLCLRQERGTCQRRGDAVGGEGLSLLSGSQSSQGGAAHLQLAGKTGARTDGPADQSAFTCRKTCFRTLGATDYRYEKPKSRQNSPLRREAKLRKLKMVGLPRKENSCIGML